MHRAAESTRPGEQGPMDQLVTVGHGTLTGEEFLSLVTAAGIEGIVDVRSFPGSRRYPHFGRELMQRWLPDGGTNYEWEPQLGGFRKPLSDSPNVSLRNASFRGYADYMLSDEFVLAIDRLLAAVRQARTDALAIMCSESLWWRCHRRLVADYVTLVHDVSVRHLMHDGKFVQHIPTTGVRLADARRLLYDG